MTTCPICVHAAEHGSWPQTMLNHGETHCRKCHRSWRGTSQAHCNVCCGHFSSNGTADRHWGRNDTHRDPATCAALRLDNDRFGAIWRRTGERPEMIR